MGHKFSFTTLFTIYIFLLTLTFSHAVEKIHHNILDSLSNDKEVNIIVSFIGSNSKALEFIGAHSFPSRGEKLNFVKRALQRHTETTQKSVQNYLTSLSIDFTSFWISNQIFVKGADRDLIECVAAFPEVEQVRREAKVTFGVPWTRDIKLSSKSSSSSHEAVEWNIEKIRTEEAWKITNGSGVVAGIIDSGVQHTHEALRDNFRGIDYGWFDAVTNRETPSDWYGHGTHVTGTVAGSKGIGVAPGAEWIFCQGCSSSETCSEASFVTCCGWMLCPTKTDGSSPDCSKAPNLVSNSWGWAPGLSTYEPITAAWVAAGIVPIFSIGNANNMCETAIAPGDSRNTIGVGSTDMNEAISSASSAGPAVNHDEIKPEITATGTNIRSSYVGESDTVYATMSGTSMACPHISGVCNCAYALGESKYKCS